MSYRDRRSFSRLVPRVAVGTLLVSLLLLLRWHLDDVRYIWHYYTTETPSPPVDVAPGDKVVVMAKLQHQNTDWVAQFLPEYVFKHHLHARTSIREVPLANSIGSWQTAIYTVDAPAKLRGVPTNKGHESMAYLTYLIDHYDTLPSTIAFLHSHRNGYWTGWHTDARGHDNVESLRALRLDTVQRLGYVNLRCQWSPGCKPAHRKNAHVTPEIWRDIFNTSEAVPELLGAACCAQFAVSNSQVQRRSKSDYERIRQWVLDTPLSDRKSGRVMEFLWHVIFGKDAV
ncbi:MAG: hypothetical protein M1833_000190 [Piccolia ochrophora]|nr:MAG: hypothetical protein M1833_000190 [Piccolia ochrophora]